MKCHATLLLFLLTQNAFAESKDPDYEAITETIRSRIVALKQQHPVLEELADAPRSLTGGIGLQHAVTWKLDDPVIIASKLNARLPVYESEDAFWCHVTFYRGPYGGTARHQPIRFCDLRVWLNYGYNKDATVIGAITKVIREEKKKFDEKYPGLSEKTVWQDQWFQAELTLDERDALVERSKKEPFSKMAPLLLKVLVDYASPTCPSIGDKPWSVGRMTSRQRTYWMAVPVWHHHLEPRDDPAKTDILLALLRKVSRPAEKSLLISVIRSKQWNAEAEQALAEVANSKNEPSSFTAICALLSRADINTYMPLAIEYTLAQEKGLPRMRAFSSAANLGNRLLTLNAKNKQALLSIGFEILTALPEEELRHGYFVAIQLGFLLEVSDEFKPDQKAKKYQSESGLKEEFFVDTVKNALAWHAKNWKGQADNNVSLE